MLGLLPRTQGDNRYATIDRVVLSNGHTVEVPRANLAAAKALLAAQKAAERQMSGANAATATYAAREHGTRRRVS